MLAPAAVGSLDAVPLTRAGCLAAQQVRDQDTT